MLLYLICSCVEKKVTSKTVQKIINLCGIFGVGGNSIWKTLDKVISSFLIPWNFLYNICGYV